MVGARGSSSAPLTWKRGNSMSASGMLTTGRSKLKRRSSPPILSPVCRICAGRCSPVREPSSASKKEKAATTPATGVPGTGPRTAIWRTITTSVVVSHRPRSRPCSPEACAAGMCRERTPSGMKNIRTRRWEE